jgi:hypothetical protein
MTINDVTFNNPDAESMIVGNIFFSNGYSISLLRHTSILTYDTLTFCIRNKDNRNLWVASMDTNLLTISETNNLTDLTEEQINNYIQLVENLPNG